MTLALATLEQQATHYAAVRARLWPMPRPVAISSPKPEWETPTLKPLYPRIENRIAAILVELARRPRINTRTVIRATSEVFNVPVPDVVGDMRIDEHVRPRPIAMAISWDIQIGTRFGTKREIGGVFGRDHTTVLYACSKYGAAVRRVRERVFAEGAE